MPQDSILNRRRFLKATGGTAAAISLAGCTGGNGDDDSPSNESDGNQTETQEVYTHGSLGVTAEDDYTLSVELSSPFHQVLEMLAYSSFAAVPEGIVGDIEGYDGEMSHDEFSTSNPVGSGPFQFDGWTPEDTASVTQYGDYHGEGADLDAINWQIMEDQNAMYERSMNQNTDFIAMPTAQYDPSKVSVEGTDDLGREYGTYGPLRNGETANYQNVATTGVYYIGFNTDNVEKPARQATAYVLNQQSIVNQVFKQRGEPAYHVTPPNIYPGGAPEYDSHASEAYPYGVGESLMQDAIQVMEEAGYSSSNRYEYTITLYEGSTTWQDAASILRDRLQAAHIDLTIESAPFSTLLQRGRNGNLAAYSLGWIMDWPAPDNFLQLLNPPQTDTSQSAPISYINWSGTDAAEQAASAWQTVSDNLAPTEEAEQARGDAYVQIEEANWEDVGFLPLYHNLEERFWYDWVDVPRFGAGGPSRQKHNNTTKSREGSNTLELLNSSMTTLDPIRATDTASGVVIQQMFDGLTNYPNGEIVPENLLAADYEVSDDFTTYTFNLKEGATFHNGDEVTAQDFVYSFDRLAGSSNSRRAYFILDSLGVTHETHEEEVQSE